VIVGGAVYRERIGEEAREVPGESERGT